MSEIDLTGVFMVPDERKKYDRARRMESNRLEYRTLRSMFWAIGSISLAAHIVIFIGLLNGFRIASWSDNLGLIVATAGTFFFWWGSEQTKVRWNQLIVEEVIDE